MIGGVLRDRYEVVEAIGEGGMARVYRGVDRRLSRSVVLKVLRADLAGNAEFRERFQREASNAARLAHANVVKVHDVDEEDGLPFIVMEYYPATDLKSIIKREGRLEPRKAVPIALAVLDALDYAHSQGIIHRDLKPHNILITDRNDVKITDFGIAKALQSDSLTQAGTMMGTAHYFSPEQAQGQPVGPATDIYSFGVVLYEMLSGRVPFTGDNPVTVGLKHVQEEPPSLESLNVRVSPALEDAVMKALQKSPTGRFSDAAAFAAALQAAPLTVESRNGSTARTPATVAAAPLAAAAVDETIVKPITAVRPSPTPHAARPPNPPTAPAEPPPEAPPTRRNGAGAKWLVPVIFVLVASLAGLVLFLYGHMQEMLVPDLRGMSEDVARSHLERAGLRLLVKDTQYYENAAPGTIMDQSPAAGTRVRPGDGVSVVLSRGRQTVQVPPVEHMDRQGARKALEDLGLQVRFTEQYSDSVPLGQVISQDPTAGTSLDLRATVRVEISKGPPQVAVPALLGRTQDEASERASKAGLKISVRSTRADRFAAKGTIVEQKPTAGTKLSRGGTVEIVLSSGPETRRVPNMVGMTLAQARKTASSLGFSLVVDGPEEAEAHVQDQDIPAGSDLPQGSRIHVKLEPLPTPEEPSDQIKVPNLLTLTEASAQVLLDQLGLRIGNVDHEKTDVAAPGTVLRQSPAEGTAVKKGSTVDIVIAAPKD